jgi:hypothetical protein
MKRSAVMPGKRRSRLFTGEHEGDVATIEVDELDLGDQFAVERINAGAIGGRVPVEFGGLELTA